MPENTDIEEEPPKGLTTNEPEEKPAEDITSAEPGNVIQHQEATGMEVHKHPHHVTHKKKWTEYLLEFMMLFLAVYLGFLAENFREHRVEKERAKQYVESFYEDLKTDTTRISALINYDDGKLTALDNLSNCYDEVSKNTKETSCLLEVIRNTAANKPFKMTERTLNQLFNAGGFRLLQKEDADSISSYQKQFNDFQDFQSTVFQEAQDNVRNSFNLLVGFNANAKMFNPGTGKTISSFDDKDITVPLLFSGDKALLNKYFNELQLYYRVTYTHRKTMLALKENQISLIHYFESKYRFE